MVELCLYEKETAMKRFAICIISVLIFSLLLFGCLNMKTTVKLNKDGSGQIEQIFLINSSIASMMNPAAKTGESEEYKDAEDGTATEGTDEAIETDEEYSPEEGDAIDEDATEPGAPETPDIMSQLMDKEKLEQNAKEMGEGVTLTSSEPFEEGGFSGYKAIYSFKDINKLKINQNPGDLMPKDAGTSASGEEKEYITFAFKKGAPAALTINMPDPEAAKDKKKEPAKDAEMDEQTINMMKEIYKDMKITMEVAVQGTITDSNAQYKKAGTITLLNLDFNKILADKTTFNTLMKSQANSLEEMKVLVKKVKGLEVELQKTVNVKFK
jgi:hypothetical protein